MDFGSALAKLWPNGDQKIPGLRAGIIASAPAVFAEFKITRADVLLDVMAQISHECGAGHDVVENLNYTASRMVEVWPSRFPSVDSAQPFAGNPRALANKVYNGRMGNQPYSDDGWNFRGRGGAQTTGRDEYDRLGKFLGLELVSNPDLLNDPRHFLRCAVGNFVLCGCLPYAEKGDFVTETKKLNGGLIGYDQRLAWRAKWREAAVPVPMSPQIILPPPPTPPDVPKPEPKRTTIWDVIAAFITAFFKRK
jgi:putative chitinase